MTGGLIGFLVFLFFLLGIASALHALLNTKRAQSTSAWIMALVFMPIFSVPLYWVFGRNKYYGYLDSVERFTTRMEPIQKQMLQSIDERAECRPTPINDERIRADLNAFEFLAASSFTGGNNITLLVNGEAVYGSIFDGIDSAQRYVLVQFYTIRSDDIGVELKERLLAAKKRGVAVYVLYDYIGSLSLSDDYVDELESAGILVSKFSGDRSFIGRFRLNFRNHRKIVVIDGETSFTGGLNVGDEYLGRDESIGDWRDTHVRISGPATLDLQMSFAKDWFFATDSDIDETQWNPTCNASGSDVLILDTGPHDELRSCGHFFAHLVSSAKKRVWIATPYLVPDSNVIGALQLAAMRGVDLRVIVPRATDSLLFKYVPYAFIDTVLRAGGKVFFYENDFMHQKVALVDEDCAVVTTANFDNRSFFLNFEVSCIVRDSVFCGEIERMLSSDLDKSSEITLEEVEGRTTIQRLATQLTRLLAPIL